MKGRDKNAVYQRKICTCWKDRRGMRGKYARTRNRAGPGGRRAAGKREKEK